MHHCIITEPCFGFENALHILYSVSFFLCSVSVSSGVYFSIDHLFLIFAGEVSSSARVTVKGAPQIKRPLRSLELKENEKISMECNVTGFPEPDCVWTRNGNPIEDPRVKTKVEKVNSELLSMNSLMT